MLGEDKGLLTINTIQLEICAWRNFSPSALLGTTFFYLAKFLSHVIDCNTESIYGDFTAWLNEKVAGLGESFV